MNKSKATLKKDWVYFFRGMKEIHRIQPYTILVALVSGFVTSGYPLITIYFSSQIINELTSSERSVNKIIGYVVATIGLTFLGKLISNFLNQMLDVLQYIAMHKKELHLADKGYQLDYSDMEDPKIRETREKLNQGRFHTGILAIAIQFKSLVGCCFTMGISISFVIHMFTKRGSNNTRLDVFVNSPLTTVAFCSLIALSLIYTVMTESKVKKMNFKLMNESDKHFNFSSFYIFNLSMQYNAGKNIRLYQQKPLMQKEIRHHHEQSFRLFKKGLDLEALYRSISSGINTAISSFAYILVGLKAMAKVIGVGDIVLYTGMIQQFNLAFLNLASILTEMKTNSQYLEMYFAFADLPNRKESGKKKINLENIKDTEIEFRNVSFRYPSSDSYSLRNVSIRVQFGDRIAIVGKNGSGKTTFIKLLCRLYDPEEGEILLNGVNIKEYDYSEDLALFSVVFQDFNIYSFKLGENVAASLDFDENRVNDCIEKVGLRERVSAFPNGLMTQLYNEFSEDGVEISGGEAQKIAIARALYKDAPFVVLDEPTAALDPIAEADIYARLNQMIKDKTAIYISHRLSSCYFCKKIAVFDQGELVQYGSHKELLKEETSLYHELWNAQAQYYSELPTT